MNFWELLIGILVGIVTNLIAWWILFHLIVPNLKFSPKISKLTVENSKFDKSGYRYRIKFENSGKRPIIDVDITARLRIKALGKFKHNWQIFYLPLKSDGSSTKSIPKIYPITNQNKLRHIIRLYINSKPEEFDLPVFPDSIRKKIRRQDLTLEDLLDAGSATTLEIQAFGYDQFSGTRKLFQSKRYQLSDIVFGGFDTKGLSVIPKIDKGVEDIVET